MAEEITPKELDTIEVKTLDGVTQTLGELWVNGPVMLVFIRHFGWLFWREYAAQLLRSKDQIKQAGATIAFIGTGIPAMAKEFSESYAPNVPVLADELRRSYQAVQFKRSLWKVLSPAVMWAGIKTILNGYLPHLPQGDGLQQGGIIVVAPPNRMLYRYAAKHAADHPPLEKVLDALKASKRWELPPYF